MVPKPSPYAASYNFTWLSASGTACLLAAVLGAMVAGLKPRQFARVLGHTARQLALAELTLAAVLALAFLMNYSGATATLGLAFAATGALFPFFSALLGWLGVFLTGSDTSANALFGTCLLYTSIAVVVPGRSRPSTRCSRWRGLAIRHRSNVASNGFVRRSGTTAGGRRVPASGKAVG